MKRFFTAAVCCCLLFSGHAQKTTGYFTFQYNTTIHDATAGNNPWSIGIGTQMFFGKSKVKPTIELTADFYGYSDKVLVTYSDGTPIDAVGGMINLFPGASYHPAKNVFFSLSAGPGLIQKIHFGIKPAAGFYLNNQKCQVKISYIHIYNREEREKEDFGSVSISVGVKMF